MPEKCSFIPTFENKDGEVVESKLFRTLLFDFQLPRADVKEIYNAVHSDEFLNWFGDWINNPESVKDQLDENGEPAIFYHRSNTEFNEFDDDFKSEGPIGYGFYFATSRDYYESDDSYGEIEYPVFLRNIAGKSDVEATVSNSVDIKSIYNKGFLETNDIYDTVPSELVYEQRHAKPLQIEYTLRVIKALQNPKLTRKDVSTIDGRKGLVKDLIKYGATGTQASIVLDYIDSHNIEKIDKNELITGLLSDLSYAVEVTTAVEEEVSYTYRAAQEFDGEDYYTVYEVINQEGQVKFVLYTEDAAIRKTRELGKPTKFYSNLTVPGGTNYTENEIRTPDIIPSIKGHAQFSTDEGIGWFRSDEAVIITKEDRQKQFEALEAGVGYDIVQTQATGKTKTRRILEVQSDLFQKGRDKKVLTTTNKSLTSDKFYERDGKYYWYDEDAGMFGEDSEKEITKEIYEKGISGKIGFDNKANNFLQLLNKDNNWVTFFIKSIIQDSAKKGYEKVLFPKGETAAKIEGHETIADDIKKIDNELAKLKTESYYDLSKLEREANIRKTSELEQRKQDLKSQGVEKLRPIEGFYEIRVGNILKKIDPNIKTITDEYGNQWYEYAIKSEDATRSIDLMRKNLSNLEPEVREDLEKKKAEFLKVFPEVSIIEDDTIPQIGILSRSKDGSPSIRINPTLMTKDTIGHEFGHLLIDMMGGLNNTLVKSAREALRESEVERRVFELYPDLVLANDGRIDKEVIAQAIGEETAKIFDEENKQSRWERILNRIFRWFRTKFGVEKDDIRNLTKRLFVGKPLEEFEIGGELDPYPQEQRKGGQLNSEVKRIENKLHTEKENVLTALRARAKIHEKTGNQARLDKVNKQIEKIEQERDHIKWILGLANQSNLQVNRLYREWQIKKDRDLKGIQKLTISDLSKIKNAVGVYQILAPILNIIKLEFSSTLLERPGIKKALQSIQDTLNKVEEMENMYDTRGIDILSEEFAPYAINRLKTTLEQTYREDYSKLTKSQKESISKDQFIKMQSEKRTDEELLDDARSLIRSELKKTSGDVNSIEMYIGNLLDTKDAVTSIMVRKVHEATLKQRFRTLEFKEKLIPILRELEEMSKDKLGMLPNMAKLYDFMLEDSVDEDGNKRYTGRVLMQKSDKFWDVFKSKKQEIEANKSLTELQKVIELLKWKDENAPKNIEEEKKDLNLYMDSLVKKGKLTNKDIDKFWENEKLPYKNKKNLEDLLDSDSKAELIINWKRQNSWNYRKPTTKWLDPKWIALDKILKDKNDPRTKFYNLYIEASDELDNIVPYKFRLRNKLPGIKKSGAERLGESQSIVNTVIEEAKRGLTIQPDDTERGQSVVNELGKVKKFLPIYFSHTLDIEDQSLDLASILFKRYRAVQDYNYKNEILPEIEMAKHFIENRSFVANKTLRANINKVLRGNSNTDDEELEPASKSNLAKQVDEWFSAVVYGERKKEGKTKAQQKTIRILDWLNKYASFNLLGLNFIQGTANALLAEVMQIGEVVSGEYYSVKDYNDASIFYTKNLLGIVKDIGNRKPENIVSQLLEKFDILNEYEGGEFRKNTRFKQLMNSSTLFFTSHAGEHFTQTRAFLAMLHNKEAKNNKGEVIGKMIHMYEVDVNGNLKLKDEVDLEKSEWTEIDQIKFEAKAKRRLAHLHGEYSDIGRTMMQRAALTRMAFMFRKFIFPGFIRRWRTGYYNEFLEEWTEGTYISFSKFFKNMWKELRAGKMSFMSEAWDDLSAKEKANFLRTMSEITFFFTALILSGIVGKAIKDGDDDDERKLAFLAYQVYRMRTELTFFINPYDAFKILRSPAASMTVIENAAKLLDQLVIPPFEGFDVYERGSWEGRLKLEKSIINLIPAYRQIYRFKYLPDQLSWFKTF